LNRGVIDLELPKISMKKLQTVITFDKKIGWRRVKNESCLKRGNKSHEQYSKGIGVDRNSKNPPFTIIFYF